MALSPILSTSVGLPAAPEVDPGTASPDRVQVFEDALTRRQADLAAGTEEAAAANAPSQTNGADLDAQERARRGLGLEAAEATPAAETDGDMILNGLQRMREVFDVRETHISELMSRSSVDANTMLAMQMEVANFTLLVEMTSKLTGKSTQSLDTLMKGQ